MKALINRNKVGGRLKAPASKSYTIRGLMCAALARGESETKDPLSSDDTEAAARVLNQVGVSVRPGKDSWPVSGGDFHPPEADLCCGDSAATLRFMTASGATIPGQ